MMFLNYLRELRLLRPCFDELCRLLAFCWLLDGRGVVLATCFVLCTELLRVGCGFCTGAAATLRGCCLAWLVTTREDGGLAGTLRRCCLVVVLALFCVCRGTVLRCGGLVTALAWPFALREGALATARILGPLDC